MSPMVYASNLKSGGFYAVHLKAIYLREGGGPSAQIEDDDVDKMHRLDISESALNSGNVIVDSGTTDSYFTRGLNAAFQKVWKEIMGNSYNHSPVTLTEKEIRELPTIIVVMRGHQGGVGDEVDADPSTVPGYVGDAFDGEFEPTDVVLAIPGSHYMEYDPDSGKYVARFYTDENSGSVLGANAMMGHDIYFDTTHQRIGFAESDCDYNSLVLKEGGKSISVAPEEQAVKKTELPAETPQENYEEDYDDEEYNDEAYEDDAEEWTSSVDPEEKSGSGGSSSGSSSGKDGISTFTDMANGILDDMKHECSSASCRGVAAFLILAAASFVLLMIRRTIARRRVVRQYQEAELEISDLALDSEGSDEDFGYEDDPPSLPRIS